MDKSHRCAARTICWSRGEPGRIIDYSPRTKLRHRTGLKLPATTPRKVPTWPITYRWNLLTVNRFMSPAPRPACASIFLQRSFWPYPIIWCERSRRCSRSLTHHRFRPLDLPTPTDVRMASGRPGPKYWQQRVDYKIARNARPRAQRAPGTREDPLHQSFSRYTPYLLAVRRAESLRAEQYHQPAESTAARLPRRHFRLLVSGVQWGIDARVAPHSRRGRAKRTRFTERR